MKPKKTIPKDSYTMIFAERIKYLRMGMNMTQAEFSEYLNVSQQTINTWEAAKNTPKISTLAAIAEKFNVSIDWLFGKELPKEIIYQIPKGYEAITELYGQLNILGKQKAVEYITDLTGINKYTEREKATSVS